jgi:hypothetical protein
MFIKAEIYAPFYFILKSFLNNFLLYGYKDLKRIVLYSSLNVPINNKGGKGLLHTVVYTVTSDINRSLLSFP